MANLLDTLNIVPALVPDDLPGSAALANGVRVSLKGYGKVAIAAHINLGDSDDPVTLHLQQAQDVEGTGEKDLLFTTIYVRSSATSLATVGVATRVTQVAAASYVLPAGDVEALLEVEVAVTDLDATGGFTALRARLSRPHTSTHIGSIQYVLGSPKLRTGQEFLANPLVD